MPRFASYEEITAATLACLDNATRLLNAARDVNKPGQHHIAYHLAAMSLEEVGKASMISLEGLVLAVPHAEHDDERRPIEWIEDHEKKLFWALWTPSFREQLISVQQLQQFQGLAKDIHSRRLASLYVNLEDIESRNNVTEPDVRVLVQIAESRLEMEKIEKPRDFGAVDVARKELITWFFGAVNSPELRGFVFGGESLKKLAEFQGDSLKWVSWLRETFTEAERVARELTLKELNRPEPVGKQRREPKWQLKIRLKTGTHSIRPKVISQWNRQSDWIKLLAPKKNELLIEYTLQKGFAVQAVWPAGMELATILVVSFNIGTLGLFWWYLPTFTSKFYESLTDLESKRRLELQRDPPLVVAQAPRALNEQDLNNVGFVLAHLLPIFDKRSEPYKRYFRAIGLLAKNDIFGEFQHTLLTEFSEIFKMALQAYGVWDGLENTLDQATENAFGLSSDDQFVVALKESLRLSDETRKDPTKTTVKLDDALKMKTFCEAFFLKTAKAEIQSRRKAESHN
jgi:AbiV family abortive infection protein